MTTRDGLNGGRVCVYAVAEANVGVELVVVVVVVVGVVVEPGAVTVTVAVTVGIDEHSTSPGVVETGAPSTATV